MSQEILKEVPKAPKHLGKIAKEKYAQIAEILVCTGQLKRSYLPALEVMAAKFAQWDWANSEIERKNSEKPGTGYKQIYPNGTENISVELTVKRDAEKILIQLFKQFGMDPKSLKELKHVEPEDKEDLYDKMLKMKETN